MAARAGNTDLDQLNPAWIPLLDPGHQSGTVGTAVDVPIAPADPVLGQTLSFSVTGLPPGLQISVGGLISGAPSSAGSFSTVVRASDGQGHSGTVSFGWTIRS
jgi:hypothetical protein